jgi:hypothetical protein
VQGGDGAATEGADQRELQDVDVEMKHVELVGALPHLLQHHRMMGQGIAHGRVEAQRHIAAGHQFGRGAGIGAGEQRDLVALTHEFLGEIGNDPFGAAIERRRDALIERRDLSDLHRQDLLRRAKHRQ